jgi:ketosteroid isomerase-like protein
MQSVVALKKRAILRELWGKSTDTFCDRRIFWEVVMSNEVANVKILKEAYRQWHETQGGSVDQFFAFLDDDILFGSIARGEKPLEFARQYNGKAELRGYFDNLLKDWEMIHYRIDEYVAQGDAVVACGTCAWTNRKTGKPVETPKVDFWRFRNGKAVEFYEYFDTAKVASAAAG